MSTSPRWKNNLIAFLALTTVGGAGLALYQHRQIVDLRNSGQLTVINTAPTTTAPKAYLSGTDAESPKAEATPDPVETPAANTETDNNRRGNRGAEFAARMKELMQDPDFVAAWQIQQRARLDNRYADLFRKLNLPADQLAKFQDLLIERQNAWQDVMATARETGLDPRENRDELRQMVQSLQSEIDSTIKTELGDSVYSAYQQYDSTQNQRNVVSQLNQKLVYSGSTLTSAQSDQIVSIISQNGGSLDEQTINLVSGLLTADQTAALKQIYAEQAASALVRSKMGGGPGGPGGPGGGFGP